MSKFILPWPNVSSVANFKTTMHVLGTLVHSNQQLRWGIKEIFPHYSECDVYLQSLSIEYVHHDQSDASLSIKVVIAIHKEGVVPDIVISTDVSIPNDSLLDESSKYGRSELLDGMIKNALASISFEKWSPSLNEEDRLLLSEVKRNQLSLRANNKDKGWVAMKDVNVPNFSARFEQSLELTRLRNKKSRRSNPVNNEPLSPKYTGRALQALADKGVLLMATAGYNGRRFKLAESVIPNIK